MKDWPEDSHLVLESVYDDIILFAVRYKYSKKKMIYFLFIEVSFSIELDTPYIAK